MGVLVESNALRKAFGPILAVDGISLSVRKGEVLGFLGPNGAGKSTTMKMITGFLEPDEGTSSICGFDVQGHPLAAKYKLGYLPEGAPLYAEMTPRSFLSFIAEVRGDLCSKVVLFLFNPLTQRVAHDILKHRKDILEKISS